MPNLNVRAYELFIHSSIPPIVIKQLQYAWHYPLGGLLEAWAGGRSRAVLTDEGVNPLYSIHIPWNPACLRYHLKFECMLLA